ncbi:MAG: cation transporter [Bacteroidales bacterium]|nr:cation transporter [Bacteroidales bacterium]MCF8404654.1 cation transporter [Bacteroidales bacterium]
MIRSTRVFISILFAFISFSVFAQDAGTEVKEKFKVYGNCEMCKKTIEKAGESVDGVNSAKWSISGKMITVKYDSTKTNLETIKKAIADVGYDTEEYRAKDEIYNALHKCCKYDRPEPLNK